MENLNRDSITELLNPDNPKAPAVTIYLPTHRAASPPHMTEDQIRAKNLFNKAAEILRNRDDGKAMAQTICDRLEEMLADRGFWEDQAVGLLICARPGLFKQYHLPIDTEEYVAVAEHFHLAPIFGVLEDMQEYYVLTVAQHAPRLFKGDFYDLHETDLELPATVESALLIDEMNPKTENQGSAVGSSMNPAGFNGRGGSRNPAEAERQRFWRFIDGKVNEYADTKLPLILAGIDAELAEYRSITKYPKVVEGGIQGSFGGENPVKPHDLFEQAFEVLRAQVLDPAHDEIIAEYERAKGQAPELAAHEVAAIANAAEVGRVDKLLLAGVRYTTDTVRDNSEPVPVLAFPPEESAQAVHDIAYRVWNAGGKVVNIEVAHMPEAGALMLATTRY